MHKDDYQKFQALWKAAVGIYGRDMDDLALMMVFRALSKFDIADIQRALDRHMNDSDQGRFMPKPADIVKYIEGDSGGKGLMAWAKFVDAIARPGVWESVVFDDPLIMAVIENMGGWIKWERVTNDELPFLKNDFVKLYKSFQITPPVRYPHKLIGKSEAYNSISGFSSFVKEPHMIGDRDLALEVYNTGSESKPRPQRISSSQTVKAIEFVEGESTDG